MVKKLYQNSLYQKRNLIKQKIQPIELVKEQKSYIKKAFSKYKSKIKIAIALIFTAVILEITIPLLTNIFIKKYSFQLDFNSLFTALICLLVLAIIYLIIAFFRIKFEKEIIIRFINDLRREWMSLFLKKSVFVLKNKDKGSVLTKINYHFMLLQMGLSNAFFSSLQWIMLSIGLIVSTFFISTTLLKIVLIMIPIDLVILFIGYIISKYYVSQEQTLYSKILRYVSDVFDEFSLIKLNRKEKDVLSNLDNMVELDTYFRVRRDVWMKFGNKVIFIVLALLTAGFYLLEIYYPFLKIENSQDYIVYIIVSGLLVQLVYLSLRIGLFSFPLYLGLSLSISDKFPVNTNFNQKSETLKEIIFKSDKTKLSRHGEYIKNIEYKFKKGERILFTGKEGSGKTSLARILSGFKGNTPAWVIKLNGKRYLYNKWNSSINNAYLIDPHFQTESTIFETLTKEGFQKNTSPTELENITNYINEHDELSFIFDHAKLFGKEINKTDFSFSDIALLQMAYCLIHKPSILVIDNLWLDINHSKINKMLEILDKKLKDTVIICFSTRDNKIINYAQKNKI